MSEYVDVAVSDLLLDQANARLQDTVDSQQATMLALASQQGSRLINLAEDIAKHGLDPSALPCVVATGDRRKRYRVIEGNRRVLALKALDTPSLVTPVMDQAAQRRLIKAAETYADSAPDTVQCVLFESEDAARHWVELRHTGENEGVGLVAWGAQEQDRFLARHGAKQSPAGQVLDFVEKRGHLTDAAQRSNLRVITNLARLLNTSDVRDLLGIELTRGDIYSRFPADEVAPGLSRIVDDLKTGKIKVNDIYYSADRQRYMDGLPKRVLPSARTVLDEPVSLSDLTAGSKQPRAKPQQPRRRKQQQPRTSMIPKDCQLNVEPPRINSIYNELSTIPVEQFPNACSVALRVFLELSIDHHITEKSLMTDDQRRNAPLAKRLKTVAADLRKHKKIDDQLEGAVKKIADGASSIAATTVTFNQYVHNKFVFPMPSELRTAWDELQPFMERLWP